MKRLRFSYLSHVGSDYQLFFDEETVEGTPDTTVQYKAAAQHQRVTPQLPANLLENIQSGSFVRLLDKGIHRPTVAIQYIPHIKGAGTLLKESILGTKTFTMIVRHTSGSPLYVFKGMRAQRTELSFVIYPTTALLMAAQTFTGLDVQSTEPAAVTYETWPTTRFALSDVVLKRAAVALTDWHSFRLMVENRLEALPNPATMKYRLQKVAARRVSGEFVRDFSNFTEFDDIVSSNAADIAIELGPAVADVYTATSARYENVDPPIAVEDLIQKRLPFIGQNLTVA